MKFFVLIGMGLPYTADDRGYWLWLQHHWLLLAVPAACFYTVVAAWVIHKARGSV